MSITDEPKPVKAKLGRPKGSVKPAMPPEQKLALIEAASSSDPDSLSKMLADRNMTRPTGIMITEDHMTVVLARYAAGETITAICIRLGIESSLVRQRFIDQPQWREAYFVARRLHADALVDEILPVVSDPTRPAADKRLHFDALSLLAKWANRAEYGDKVQIDQRQVIINLTEGDLDLG